MLFQIPHVGGFDDPRQPWWPISNEDARMLADPTTRMLARLPAARAAALALWIDPITLLLGVAALVGPRLEMTRAYSAQMRIQVETEARRRAIARDLETAPNPDAGRGDNSSAPRAQPEANAESPDAGARGIVQDLFDSTR